MIAGEPSGDALGAALMQGLLQLRPETTFDGIGGPLMQRQGLRSRFDMDELSLMGLVEILPKYLHLKRRIAETAATVCDTRPDVLVTIDSPDFCLRVARAVKARANIRCVHYVAPTVWAWRAGRARKIAQVVDQVLALFPFEPPYFEAEGLRCDFVGHPIVSMPQPSAAEATAFRTRVAPDADPLVLVLPGSRRSEVARLAPVFGDALRRFCAARPGTRIVVPAAPAVAGMVAQAVLDWPGNPVVLDQRASDPEDFAATKRAAFRAADVALAASGTVSLELAAAGTPMVIAYDMHWLTRWVMSRMLLTDTVTLVNLVSDTRTVPEFIGDRCRPDLIAGGMAEVLGAPDAQTAAMTLTVERLGQGGEAPGLRAARAVLDGLGLKKGAQARLVSRH
jgi:lipid-A-disaccharide synthase